ncbi:hypothetical protein TrRE_jg8885 [Triparma retinervis]|uniref:Uncharacterized protein n=1 Tax=Triparma retinervis TaxID=2557542 RepID=A0A9W6ZXG1_9STRA|nr:hypothetical protein TrRE_jg8885 [Triparma retinervis]
MPSKTKKSANSKKTGKGKKSKKVVPGHEHEEMAMKVAEKADAPEPEPWKPSSDPWKKHRSVYGGGLSPAEQWDMLISDYKGKEEVENDLSGVTLTPEMWSGLDGLRLLYLQGCGLTKVFESLTALPNLKVLDVSSNALGPSQLSLLISLPLNFKRSLTSLTILPNPLSTDPELPSLTSNLLKSLPCLSSFQGAPFSHTVAFDASLLSSLSLSSNDVEGTDSSTCSCVFGNPCLTKDTCKTWIWHRKEEIAERSRKEGDFDPELWLKGPQD